MEMRGIEPRTFRMQSGRSTTELHPVNVHNTHLFYTPSAQKLVFLKILQKEAKPKTKYRLDYIE